MNKGIIFSSLLSGSFSLRLLIRFRGQIIDGIGLRSQPDWIYYHWEDNIWDEKFLLIVHAWVINTDFTYTLSVNLKLIITSFLKFQNIKKPWLDLFAELDPLSANPDAVGKPATDQDRNC